MATALVPYLFFNGNCKEAMEFYHGIFGGEITMQFMSEVPDDSAKMPGSKDSDVMHASISGGEVALMASDSTMASEKAAKVELSINGDDEAAMRAIFEKLSEDGEVRQALEKQFWGDTFGSLRDKFGVDWMMNISGQK
jgi:PhnB protein